MSKSRQGLTNTMTRQGVKGTQTKYTDTDEQTRNRCGNERGRSTEEKHGGKQNYKQRETEGRT